jgi:hypothetical protein
MLLAIKKIPSKLNSDGTLYNQLLKIMISRF